MDDLIKKIDECVVASRKINEICGTMSRALSLAKAVNEIRSALKRPEVINILMSLQNSSLGFRTDETYSSDVVAECAMDAMLNGLELVGNEWNIIAGRMYITKEGMHKKLKSISGLSYSITSGIPQMVTQGATIKMEVSWTYKEESATKVLEFPVRVNKNMGADAIIGKATRKARAWLYSHITGSDVPEGEVEDMKNITPKKEIKPLFEQNIIETPSCSNKSEINNFEYIDSYLSLNPGLFVKCENWSTCTFKKSFIDLNNDVYASIVSDFDAWLKEIDKF